MCIAATAATLALMLWQVAYILDELVEGRTKVFRLMSFTGNSDQTFSNKLIVTVSQ